ncbi:class I adenylate-forming enzyme family protein [Idiomarina aminovorans]|uniref:class I adenylate-forming enzyme family protein n=1 Tax=Idiomarina aminovorans TaxID=2914829 RepID=UPI0020068019|nr:AMP-binding protein [Idiomarina sp. ATCH4]MCK7458422.1 AMP-binding protein [Idiomarina sp. ATCH4]
MIIPAYVSRNARKYSNHEAVIDGERRMTWSQLNADVDSLAEILANDYQVAVGDRVCLVLPNNYTFIVAHFAVQRLGAIISPINVKLTANELDYIFNNAEPSLVISCSLTKTEAEKATADSATCPLLLIDNLAEFQQEHASGRSFQALDEKRADQPATLLYTSGTTGRPKGVLFDHQALLFVGLMFATEMHYQPESRLLSLMPYTHSAPLNLSLVGGTLMGSTHVIAPTFTPDLLLGLAERERTTHFFGAPVAYLLTAQHPHIENTDLSSMSHWIYGGGPLSAEHAKRVQKAFNSDQFYCVYGLTEAGPTGSFLRPEDHAKKAGSIGCRAAAFTEMRVVNESGDIAAIDEPGEIHIGGDGLMREYWHNPAATEETFSSDGWIKTGDIGVRDADGFYWIKDRKKDLIISGGVNVYPREIEDALSAHPAVAEVAVIGVPHPEWGETVKACVVLNKDVSEDTLRQHAAVYLADYKRPRVYQFYEELPHNANAKVLKHELRDS